jgi:hypothetical protein
MVIFEQVLRDLVIGLNLFENRVFLLRAPQVPAEQRKNPYCVFFPIGPTPYRSHMGPLGLLDRSYQFSIFDPSQTMALGLADALRSRLDGLRGDYEGVLFGGIFFDTQTWEYEPATAIFHITVEFTIQYRLVDPHPQPAVTTRSKQPAVETRSNRSFES